MAPPLKQQRAISGGVIRLVVDMRLPNRAEHALSEAQKANLLHPSCAACATSAMESPLSVHGKPRAASRTSCSPSGQCSRQAPRSRTKHGNPNRAEPNEKATIQSSFGDALGGQRGRPRRAPDAVGHCKTRYDQSARAREPGTRSLGNPGPKLTSTRKPARMPSDHHLEAMRLGPRHWSGPNCPA